MFNVYIFFYFLSHYSPNNVNHDLTKIIKLINLNKFRITLNNKFKTKGKKINSIILYVDKKIVFKYNLKGRT